MGTAIVATREKQETRTKRESSKIQRREMGQKTETHQAPATTGVLFICSCQIGPNSLAFDLTKEA
jgi:hypothetical protein